MNTVPINPNETLELEANTKSGSVAQILSKILMT